MKNIQDFSLYLKENHLRDLAIENIRIGRQLGSPFLKVIAHFSEDQLLEREIGHMEKMLTSMGERQAIAYLKENLEQWEQDKTSGLSKETIHISDVILGNASRKKALLKFVPVYTKDLKEAMGIVWEVMDYYMKVEDKALQLLYEIRNNEKNDFFHKPTELNGSDKLVEITQELTRSNKELEQFAYVASHDLQEPLRMVTSYLQLLEKRYKNKLDKDADDFIHYAVDGAARMRNLINSLLEYSRVSRIKPFENIDVNLLINELIIHDLKDLIQESTPLITCDKLHIIYGDSVLIGQLFLNLIGNAIKFRGDIKPEIHISSKKEANATLYCIKDNGIGIKSEYFEKIFVIFQRLNSKEKYPGTGIGLAICKKIVERHGGKIWIESQPGKGSSFFFTIKDPLNQLETGAK